jgi:hypothetical protein
MQSPTTSELHLGDNTDRCATTIGKGAAATTYQFFRCFKCCFLRIEQAKRKARTCSICIPGVRICREQCKKRIVCGKHAANLASSKLELLDQLKSSLRLVQGFRFPLPRRESQSTGSRVDLARSTVCFCLSIFSLLIFHVCQRPIKRRPTALFSSHSFEPFRSHLSDPFSLIIRCALEL